MKRISILIALVLMLTAANMASVKLSYFEVNREQNNFVVTWLAELEEDVRSYELYRKTAYVQDFARIAEINQPHGAGKEYIYKDDQVYKVGSELVDYRLEVVFTDGSRQTLAQRNVNYTPTAVRRTWGSIKAMFQ